MPGQIRPDKKMIKVLNQILEKPKDLQQKNEKVPSEKRRQAWMINSYSIIPK